MRTDRTALPVRRKTPAPAVFRRLRGLLGFLGVGAMIGAAAVRLSADSPAAAPTAETETETYAVARQPVPAHRRETPAPSAGALPAPARHDDPEPPAMGPAPRAAPRESQPSDARAAVDWSRADTALLASETELDIRDRNHDVAPTALSSHRPRAAETFLREVWVEPAARGGYVVREVADGGLYAALGVQPGDVVHTLDTAATQGVDESSMIELTRMRTIELEVQRDGLPLTLQLQLDRE